MGKCDSTALAAAWAGVTDKGLPRERPRVLGGAAALRPNVAPVQPRRSEGDRSLHCS